MKSPPYTGINKRLKTRGVCLYSSMPRITRGNIGAKTNEELIAALTECEIKRDIYMFVLGASNIWLELRRRLLNGEPILNDGQVCEWNHGWLTYEQWLHREPHRRISALSYKRRINEMKEKHPQYFLTT